METSEICQTSQLSTDFSVLTFCSVFYIWNKEKVSRSWQPAAEWRSTFSVRLYRLLSHMTLSPHAINNIMCSQSASCLLTECVFHCMFHCWPVYPDSVTFSDTAVHAAGFCSICSIWSRAVSTVTALLPLFSSHDRIPFVCVYDTIKYDFAILRWYV